MVPLQYALLFVPHSAWSLRQSWVSLSMLAKADICPGRSPDLSILPRESLLLLLINYCHFCNYFWRFSFIFWPLSRFTSKTSLTDSFQVTKFRQAEDCQQLLVKCSKNVNVIVSADFMLYFGRLPPSRSLVQMGLGSLRQNGEGEGIGWSVTIRASGASTPRMERRSWKGEGSVSGFSFPDIWPAF